MATITNHSSGDLIADRRAAYAEMLADSGDVAAAAELMESVLELAPGWAAGWFRLGELREAAMDAAAVDAYARALALDPADRLGASLKLALAGAAHVPDAPPSGFVEALFDQYADRFDKSLVEKLDYRVPDLLDAAIRAAAPNRHFGNALDLGCGTGLMGERLRPICDHLTGIDLSAEMLRKAEARGHCDRLVKADLAETPLPASADLVTAADVFMYVGRLDAVFIRVAAALAPDGLFAFSVEASDAEDVALRESRRYAHSEAYVRNTLAPAGLAPLSLARQVIRQDRGDAIEGLIVVARHH